MDKKLSENFIKKFQNPSYDDFAFKKSLNSEYLNDLYEIVNDKNSEKNFNNILAALIKWYGTNSSADFRKNPQLKSSFLSFKKLNTDLSSNSLFEDNLFFKKLALIILINVKLASSQKIQHDIWLINSKKIEADLSVLDKKDSQIVIDSYYSRSFIIESIEKDLCNWALIVANTLELNINLSNIYYALSHLYLNLESNGVFEVKKKVKGVKKKVMYEIKLSFKNESGVDNFLKKLRFPYLYLSFSKSEPIRLLNLFLDSSFFKKKSLNQVPDYIFKPLQFIKSNKSYGWLKPTLVDSQNPEWDMLDSIVSHFQKPSNIEVKGEVNHDFSKDSLNILNRFFKKESQTKFYIDKKKFLEVIEIFRTNNLKNLSIDLETEDSIFLNLFETYVNFQEKGNITLLNNILIFAYLKIFYDNYFHLNYFYILIQLDFRGRKYYDSIISPTNFKLSRFFLFFGFYSSDEINDIIKLSVSSTSIAVLKPLFNKLKSLENITATCYFRKEDSEHRFYFKGLLVHFFIALGVLEKSKILSNPQKSPTGYSLSTEALFNQGVEVYLKIKEKGLKNCFNDLEDFFKASFYFESIENGPDLYKKDMIGLDFSCSGHQLRYLYNGFTGSNGFSFINVDGLENSVDLYSFIIINFKDKIYKFYTKENKVNLIESPDCVEGGASWNKFLLKLNSTFKEWGEVEEVLNYFKRSALKKSIMTAEYNASLPTFIAYFRLLAEEDPILVQVYEKNPDKFKCLLHGLYVFSKKLNNFIFEFKNNEGTSKIELLFTIMLNNKFKMKFWDGFGSGYAVFKKSQADSRVYLNIKEEGVLKRYTHQVNLYSNLIDEKSTKTALMPNFIHSLDACIVRLISFYSKTDHAYITIHDEFWIPYQEVFYFKDLMNKVIKLDFLSPLKCEEYDDPSIDKHSLSSNNFPRNCYCYNVIL